MVALSEYGITDVEPAGRRQPALRAEGLLRVYTQDGMEYLDPWTSRAFAVADHQVAHVYVARPGRRAGRREALRRRCPAWPRCWTTPARPRTAWTTPRSGELVLVAEPDAWFTYYYWLDDARAPDFARLVEIHRKPGYDPAELFFDPAGPGAAKRRAARGAAPQEARHALPDERGRPGRRRPRGPRLARPAARRPRRRARCCCAPTRAAARDRIAATEVKDFLLDLAGLGA